MKMNLLSAQPNGDLSRPVMVLLAALCAAMAFAAWYVVSRALPPEAHLARFFLAWLPGFAVPGMLQLLVLVVKIYQGGRVQVER